MLVDILRGSQRGDLVAHGYHKIRTYGAGADLSVAQWQHIIMQMVQLGIIDIAYNQGRTLKATPYGLSLLKGNTPVMMTNYTATSVAQTKGKKQAAHSHNADTLFEHLKKVRLQLARTAGLPAYLVFSDRTLSLIADSKPRSYNEFSAIDGVSRRKATMYSSTFISAIKEWELHHS